MQSRLFAKNNQNGRPGLHFRGLWGHCGALWVPNGTPEPFFGGVENWMQKRERNEFQWPSGAVGGDPYPPPLRLEAWGASKPPRLQAAMTMPLVTPAALASSAVADIL